MSTCPEATASSSCKGGMPDSPEKRTSMCSCPPDKVFTRWDQRRTASLSPGILSGQAAAKRKRVSGALLGFAAPGERARRGPSTAPHTNTFGLGETGRYRTNVWDYAGISSISATRAEELAMHPTVKPVALVADAIKDCSKRGEIVLDGFGGSGSTLIAAQKTGRRACVRELHKSPTW